MANKRKESTKINLTESQLKTAQSCMRMHEKWVTVTSPKEVSIYAYINACINGYPNKTRFTSGLLNARIRGIVRHATIDKDCKFKPSKDDVMSATALVKEYKEQCKNKVTA